MSSTSLGSRLKAFGIRRLVLWLLISLPAFATVLNLILTLAHRDDQFAATNQRLRQSLPTYLAEKRWAEAELIGDRLMGYEKLTIPEEISHFDAMIAKGDQDRAYAFLACRERIKPAAEIAPFRIRYAEKLLSSAPNSPALISRAIVLLRQSLAGGLTQSDDFKARRLLGSQAYASSDYDLAIEMLRPLESESVDVAVEIAWIRWIRQIDSDTTEALSEARKLLDELLRQASQRKKFRLVNPTPRELTDIAMLLVILGRDKEFLDVTRELIVLSPAEKDRIQTEIDDFKINAELKKKNPNLEIVAPILADRLEKNPQDIATLNQSIVICSVLPTGSENSLTKIVRARIESPNADLAMLHFAGDRCRENGKWAEARNIYSRLAEKTPDDLVVLNNLAECWYKVQPFDYPKALELAERAGKLDPRNLALVETRGQILARMGRLDEAKVLLEESLAAYPQDWNLRNTLAQLYDRLGEKDRAEGHRRILADLKPPPGAGAFSKLP